MPGRGPSVLALPSVSWSGGTLSCRLDRPDRRVNESNTYQETNNYATPQSHCAITALLAQHEFSASVDLFWLPTF